MSSKDRPSIKEISGKLSIVFRMSDNLCHLLYSSGSLSSSVSSGDFSPIMIFGVRFPSSAYVYSMFNITAMFSYTSVFSMTSNANRFLAILVGQLSKV